MCSHLKRFAIMTLIPRGMTVSRLQDFILTIFINPQLVTGQLIEPALHWPIKLHCDELADHGIVLCECDWWTIVLSTNTLARRKSQGTGQALQSPQSFCWLKLRVYSTKEVELISFCCVLSFVYLMVLKSQHRLYLQKSNFQFLGS